MSEKPFVNTLELHAREVLGKPEEWRVFLYQALPPFIEGRPCLERTHFQLTGAVTSKVLFKSGPRKGRPNPKFRTDEATVIFSEAEHHAWELAFKKANPALFGEVTP